MIGQYSRSLSWEMRSSVYGTKASFELVAAKLLDRLGEALGDPALAVGLGLHPVLLVGRLGLISRDLA